MARDVVYTSTGGGPTLIRVITRRADEITGFGEAHLWAETTRIDLHAAEVPNPRPATGSRSTARPSLIRTSRCGTASGWSGP